MNIHDSPVSAMPAHAAWSARCASGGQGHFGGYGIIEVDEQVTFASFPRDRYPAAGYPLPVLFVQGRTHRYLSWPIPRRARRAVMEYIAWYKGTRLHSRWDTRARPPTAAAIATDQPSSLTWPSALSAKAGQPHLESCSLPISRCTRDRLRVIRYIVSVMR